MIIETIKMNVSSLKISVLQLGLPIYENFNELHYLDKYSTLLLKISRTVNNVKGKMIAVFYRASYLVKMNKYAEGLARLYKSLDYAFQISDLRFEIQLYSRISMCHYYLGQIEKSRLYHQRFIQGITEPHNSVQRTRIPILSGSFYSSDKGEEFTLNEDHLDPRKRWDSARKPNKKEIRDKKRELCFSSRNQKQMKASLNRTIQNKRNSKKEPIPWLPKITRTQGSILRTPKLKDNGILLADSRMKIYTHRSPKRCRIMYDIDAQSKKKNMRSRSLDKKSTIYKDFQQSILNNLRSFYREAIHSKEKLDTLSDTIEKVYYSHCAVSKKYLY